VRDLEDLREDLARLLAFGAEETGDALAGPPVGVGIEVVTALAADQVASAALAWTPRRAGLHGYCQDLQACFVRSAGIACTAWRHFLRIGESAGLAGIPGGHLVFCADRDLIVPRLRE